MTLAQRIADFDHGLTSLHEHRILVETDYLASLLASGRVQTTGRSAREGKCTICGDRTPKGSVRVVLFEQCGTGTLARRATLDEACDRRVCETAAQLVEAG